jgi:hypothetical protein
MGFVGGCVYGAFALSRKIIAHGFWLVQFEDFLFWFLFSLIFFLIYYKINFADIRGYNFFGVAVGVLMWFLSSKKIRAKINKKADKWKVLGRFFL